MGLNSVEHHPSLTYLVKNLVDPVCCLDGDIWKVLLWVVLADVGGDVVVVFVGEGLKFVVLQDKISRSDGLGLCHEVGGIGRCVDEVDPMLLFMPSFWSRRVVSQFLELAVLFRVGDFVSEVSLPSDRSDVRVDPVEVEESVVSRLEPLSEYDDSVEVESSIDMSLSCDDDVVDWDRFAVNGGEGGKEVIDTI